MFFFIKIKCNFLHRRERSNNYYLLLCQVEPSVTIEEFCIYTDQYVATKSPVQNTWNVAGMTGFQFYNILIHLNLNNHMQLVAIMGGQCRSDNHYGSSAAQQSNWLVLHWKVAIWKEDILNQCSIFSFLINTWGFLINFGNFYSKTLTYQIYWAEFW
jgi:hypothetical protein